MTHMPRKADSHASHIWLAWLACLARLTRLPRMPHMPRMVGSHASHIMQTPLIVVSTGCIFSHLSYFLVFSTREWLELLKFIHLFFFHSPFPEARPQSNNGDESCPFSATYLISLYSLKDSKLSCWNSFILLLSLQLSRSHYSLSS